MTEGIVRLTFLNPDDCQRRYTDEMAHVAKFQPVNQGAWYSQAAALVQLAKVAYAIGQPIEECRSWLRQATVAYRELFKLRGTSFTKTVKYKNGQPASEELIANDGYTSVQSFEAVLVALTLQDMALARELVGLAGRSPNADLVSPQSEVCTSNQQTLSHALNALVAEDLSLAEREAGKLKVRRGTQCDKQVAGMISAIATNGDVEGELRLLLSIHEKQVQRPENAVNASYWLCLPALGLASIVMTYGVVSRTDWSIDSVYCPIELLQREPSD